MKAKDTKKTSNTDWERLSTMDDKDINLEDNPELTDSFFANATIRLPEPKKSVSLRLDPDVLEWYKHQGPGYQTRMNAVLRMYMRAKISNVNSSPTIKKTVKRQIANKKVN